MLQLVTAIRPAADTDAASIALIVNALLQSSTIEWRYTPYSVDATLEWMKVHDCVLVAQEDGEADLKARGH